MMLTDEQCLEKLRKRAPRMLIKPALDTPENRAFWIHVWRCHEQVKRWPRWKRGSAERVVRG